MSGGAPCANQAYALPFASMNHNEQAPPLGHAEGHKPLLGIIVVGIGYRDRQWVSEDRCRLWKTNPVFPSVRALLS